jgi:antitoxin component YwqK of YwqJK toxin-antitoxin module
MKKFLHLLLISFLVMGLVSCSSDSNDKGSGKGDDQTNIVKRRRDDGTLSSVNPVDQEGYVHGVKVNYYEDGKTVHSKVTYEHGRKHGPAIWYYKNGQIYEHTNFHYGRKQGLTRRYYDTGELMEEFSYQQGEELPGKITFNKAGQQINQ